jgi:hypothetical protein
MNKLAANLQQFKAKYQDNSQVCGLSLCSQ